jgi:hypothetical protein
MYRPLLLALAGVALAALLALGVFFASEAALGDDEPPLAPREPALVSTSTGRTTTVGTTTEDRPTTPTIRTETDEDGGRGRGRGRGRGGSENSGPGGGGSDDD